MTPASFAIVTLTALVIVTQIMKIAFEIAECEQDYPFTDHESPSGIA